MVILHHPSGLRFCIANGCAVLDWSVRNDELQRFVEIFSVHGNSEYFGHSQNFMLMYHAGHFVQDALRMGHRLGIMYSSDSHNGHPGLSGLYDYHSYEPESGMVDKNSCRGCLVGVYSKELTREAIWDALHNRRCYATTGKRIILDFRMDGHLMGEEYTARSEREIFVKVIGTAPIAVIEILQDNQVIFTRKGKKEIEEFTWYDRKPLNCKVSYYYYVRVTQKDGEMAWASPIWVSR